MAKHETSSPSSPAQSQSLYRKYRPNSFDPTQLVGQEHVARTLRNAITLDRVAHAYLFCGPRGTGKTSTARLLAKAVNCEAEDPADRPCNKCSACNAINSGSVVDIIEIDAASNRGVDDIRDLREKVRYAPTQLAVKFYIIDEAHQLTRDAFNAFLKTLEEPPGHVKFVLATTEAEKLPDTVASRCQRFDFRRIPVESTLQRLQQVCDWEEIEAEEEALLLIARHATGSLRDALGLLDQLALYGEHDDGKRKLTAQTVRQVLGLSQNDRLIGLVQAIADQNPGEGLRLITEASDQGEDVHQLNRQMVGYLRMLLHLRAGGKPPEADETAEQLAQQFNLDRLTGLVRIFSDVDAAANRSSYPQLPFELAFVQAALNAATVASAPAEATAPPVPTRPERTAPTPPPPAAPRSSSPAPATPPPAPAPTSASRAPKEPEKAQEPTPQPTVPAPSASGDGMLEHLLANWAHIRRDVKAQNSRIAALLSSADPAAVTDTQIVLAAPYEFHRNKLNEDNARLVVEGVLQQYTHSKHVLLCVAPEDVPAMTQAAPAGAPQASAASNAQPESEDGDTPSAKSTAVSEERATNGAHGYKPDNNTDETAEPEAEDPKITTDRERIEAAKRIFEAKEIPDD